MKGLALKLLALGSFTLATLAQTPVLISHGARNMSTSTDPTIDDVGANLLAVCTDPHATPKHSAAAGETFTKLFQSDHPGYTGVAIFGLFNPTTNTSDTISAGGSQLTVAAFSGVASFDQGVGTANDSPASTAVMPRNDSELILSCGSFNWIASKPTSNITNLDASYVYGDGNYGNIFDAYTVQGAKRAAHPVTWTSNARNGQAIGTAAFYSKAAPVVLALLTKTLPPSYLGHAYTATLEATGGVQAYTWRIVSGALPSGLSLSPSTGIISGTPTAASSSNAVFRVSDAANTSADSASVPVSASTYPVTVTAQAPASGLIVLPGSQRRIVVHVDGGKLNTVNWSVASTTGGATASFTDPKHAAVSSISGSIPMIQVNIGSVGSTCSAKPVSGAYRASSAATVTIRAQSVDDPTKAATYPIYVCAKTTQPRVMPAYQQVYKGQQATLQSIVFGDTDQTGTWGIVSQPPGGDGVLSDNAYRDTLLSATVQGRYVVKYTSHSNPTKFATAIVYVASAALPSYPATSNGTRPVPCEVDPAMKGKSYEVGAGKKYERLQALPPSSNIGAGSIIRIWSNLNEYWQIASSGTAAQPSYLCGVTDGSGNLPTLDGSMATAQPGASKGAAAGLGIVTAWAGGYGRGNPYGDYSSGTAGPSYWTIAGLHLKNARAAYKYIPPAGGKAEAWSPFASCINLRSGSYIAVIGNDLDNCSIGFFSQENAANLWATITQNIAKIGNHIHASGDSGSSTEHQQYTQSLFVLDEGNMADNYVAGASGTSFKYRGLGQIVRYNFLRSGPLRQLDFVDNTDAAPYVALENYSDTSLPIDVLAGFQEALQSGDYAYGNVIEASSSLFAIHYNGDQYAGMFTRLGTLQFYNNTVDSAQVVFDTGNNGGPAVLGVPGVNAVNNIFWGAASNPGGFIALSRYATEVFTGTTNLFRTGSFSIKTPVTGGHYTSGNANGWQTDCDGECTFQLATPMETHIFGLTSGNFLSVTSKPYAPSTYTSRIANTGSALTGVQAQNPVRFQWSVATGSLAPRAQPTTIGAEDATPLLHKSEAEVSRSGNPQEAVRKH